MLRLALIRHGRTDWNEEGRVQGHADLPLSDRGRREIGACRAPDDLAAATWVTSPLRRARETAALLGAPDARPVEALIEMDWGTWSGERLSDLRARDPEGMAANEAQGRHYRPLGGETPAEVEARVLAWLSGLPPRPDTIAAVTHKGVILALIAKALAWNMLGPPPVKVAWTAAHYVTFADGTLTAERLNVPLPARDDRLSGS